MREERWVFRLIRYLGVEVEQMHRQCQTERRGHTSIKTSPKQLVCLAQLVHSHKQHIPSATRLTASLVIERARSPDSRHDATAAARLLPDGSPGMIDIARGSFGVSGRGFSMECSAVM